MSSLAQPMIAPNSRVTAPTIVTAVWAVGARLNIGPARTIRYTPAVTMVAAWISAETGVGPSMASPSQDCSGTCALLAQAPSSSIRPMALRVSPLICGAAANTVPKSSDPTVANMIMTAIARPTSPTRLTMNAFLAAAPALGL